MMRTKNESALDDFKEKYLKVAEDNFKEKYLKIADYFENNNTLTNKLSLCETVKDLDEFNVSIEENIKDLTEEYNKISGENKNKVKPELIKINNFISLYNKMHREVQKKLENKIDNAFTEGFSTFVSINGEVEQNITNYSYFINNINKKCIKILGLSKGKILISKLYNKKWVPLFLNRINEEDTNMYIKDDGIYDLPLSRYEIRSEYSEDILPLGLTLEVI
ncbi:MAG: hypothetical protein LBS38_00325 [Endomicrobium sp.]|jgi:hypothetical protein|nr:hypothetical protein [Endomicrobium sp.]